MATNKNINTLDYWQRRFGTGDWEAKGGYSQTHEFAESQQPYLGLEKDFSGTLCDFGCGAGDAFPVYRHAYPNARLIGIDFSAAAIQLCREKYSTIGEFIEGDCTAVPFCDVIVTSNVLEHLEDNEQVINVLLRRCNFLFVVVPFEEQSLLDEHLRAYDQQSFAGLRPLHRVVFLSKGWSRFGAGLWYEVYFKNIFRWSLGRPLLSQRKQIMFTFSGTRHG